MATVDLVEVENAGGRPYQDLARPRGGVSRLEELEGLGRSAVAVTCQARISEEPEGGSARRQRRLVHVGSLFYANARHCLSSVIGQGELAIGDSHWSGSTVPSRAYRSARRWNSRTGAPRKIPALGAGQRARRGKNATRCRR